MTIDAMPACVILVAFGFGGCVAPRIAITSMKQPIASAPPARDQRRPILSTKKIRKKPHDTTFTSPKNPVMRRLALPAPTEVKICGA